ncbi:MAG: hypothetical protein RIQ60_4075 [Pseudomonadota bacterium]|jgi:hypothetical protein
MGYLFLLICTTTVLLAAGLFELRDVLRRQRERRRRDYLLSYTFPPSIRAHLSSEYPRLNESTIQHCLDGLRLYLSLHQPKLRDLAMPSRGVDLAWHAFVLDSRAYEAFCHQAFGAFLHHVPNPEHTRPEALRASLHRCWELNCRAQAIDPRRPSKLPLLFAIDLVLDIPGGHPVRVEDLDWLTRKDTSGHGGGSHGCGGGGCSAASGGGCGGCSGGGCGGGCGGGS